MKKTEVGRLKTEGGDTAVAPQDICERTFRFSLRIVRLVAALPRTPVGEMMSRQLARSGCGVGANVEEARGSTTRKEYSRKMSIVLAEARETHYWLRLASEGGVLPRKRLESLIGEADEIVRILVSIVKRTRSGAT